MQEARLCEDGTARWVEVCYCPTPLQEERPYWEQHFDLVRCRTRMTGGSAGTGMDRSHGRARVAIALTVWSGGSGHWGIR